ncbi:MAG: MFS transporter [Eubacteriales bacterium]
MPKPKMSLTKKVNLQFAVIQGSFWISFLPLGGFAVVLLQSRNFTDSEIGIILAMQSIASIIAQPLISTFAGKHPRIPLKKIVTAMLLFGAAISSVFFFLPHLFLPAVIIFMVIGMTEYSAPAFINAIAMQLTNAGVKINYGVSRGIGSLSFALAGVLLGRLVDISGTDMIIPFSVILVLITCVFLWRMYAPPYTEEPAVDVASPAQIPRTNILTFLRRNKVYTGFCIASSFIFACHACVSNFLPNIADSLGGSITDQGIIRGISASFELPIMFIYSILARRISSHKLLTFSAFSFFLKSLATMFVPSISLLFLVQAFQMPAFGLYTPAAVHFSDHSVTDADRVRAQAISMVAGIGIGNVFGNLVGGFILDRWGLHSMLFVATILGFIGFIIMFAALYEKPVKVIE